MRIVRRNKFTEANATMSGSSVRILVTLLLTGCASSMEYDTPVVVEATGGGNAVATGGNASNPNDSSTGATAPSDGAGSGGANSGGNASVPGVGGASATSIEFELETTFVSVVDKDESFETNTLGPVEGDAPLSKYGGDRSRNVGATGFFRTAQVDGRWYFVDPDGYLFLSVGLNSVETGGGIQLPQELRAIGFNSLGNWSDYEAINSGPQKLPYTTKYSFLPAFTGDDSYGNDTGYLESLFDAGVLPIVFSDFDEFCDKFARQIAALKDDPWMLGIFSDNELPLYDGSGTYGDVLDRWMKLPTDDAYFKYAADWLAHRGSSQANYSEGDKESFSGHLAEIYYSKVSAALKRYDPHHLYIGSRIHGAAKRSPAIIAASGKFVDVLSVNYYGEWSPSEENMNMWLKEGGKPFIISEFYVKGQDSGLGNADGAGWLVPTQADRGLFYTHWLLSFYRHPGAIGTHWFRYIDKAGQDSNKGFLTETHQWYPSLKEAAHNTNRQIYQLVEFLRP